MKKQTKIAAVVSAAALLAIGASMTSFAATGWQEENGVWVYYRKSGEKVTDTWAKSGENWFYLNDQGEMVVDSLVESNDDLYYTDANGAMVTNRWVSVDNPNAGDDANEPNAIWYYFGANGKAYKSAGGRLTLKSINGKRYAFNENGKMLFGWVSETGEMVNSTDESSWQNGEYYFGDESDGSLAAGWREISIVDNNASDSQPGEDFWDSDQTRWFYFKASGKKQKDTDGASINGAKYAFDQYGRMMADWYKKTSTDSNVTNDKATSPNAREGQGGAGYTKTFGYFSTPQDGARKTKGWFKVVAGQYLNKDDYNNGSDAWYYAGNDGKIVANEIKSINGKKYAFNEYGKMVSGLHFVEFASTGSNAIAKIHGDDDYNTPSKYSKFVTDHQADINAGKLAAYFFGSDTDGSMKTGNQTVTLDDESVKFFFKTASASKGQGENGLGNKNKSVYQAGKLVSASADDKFQIVRVYKNEDSVALADRNKVVTISTNDFKNTYGTKVAGAKKETWNISGLPADSDFYVVNTAGIIVNTGSKKDGNDYAIHFKNKKIDQITIE
jgi:putative cell wall binding repeat-containing protein